MKAPLFVSLLTTLTETWEVRLTVGTTLRLQEEANERNEQLMRGRVHKACIDILLVSSSSPACPDSLREEVAIKSAEIIAANEILAPNCTTIHPNEFGHLEEELKLIVVDIIDIYLAKKFKRIYGNGNIDQMTNRLSSSASYYHKTGLNLGPRPLGLDPYPFTSKVGEYTFNDIVKMDGIDDHVLVGEAAMVLAKKKETASNILVVNIAPSYKLETILVYRTQVVKGRTFYQTPYSFENEECRHARKQGQDPFLSDIQRTTNLFTGEE